MHKQAQDFVRCCLRKKPRERWSARRLLQHPFLDETKKRRFSFCWSVDKRKSSADHCQSVRGQSTAPRDGLSNLGTSMQPIRTQREGLGSGASAVKAEGRREGSQPSRAVLVSDDQPFVPSQQDSVRKQPLQRVRLTPEDAPLEGRGPGTPSTKALSNRHPSVTISGQRGDSRVKDTALQTGPGHTGSKSVERPQGPCNPARVGATDPSANSDSIVSEWNSSLLPSKQNLSANAPATKGGSVSIVSINAILRQKSKPQTAEPSRAETKPAPPETEQSASQFGGSGRVKRPLQSSPMPSVARAQRKTEASNLVPTPPNAKQDSRAVQVRPKSGEHPSCNTGVPDEVGVDRRQELSGNCESWLPRTASERDVIRRQPDTSGLSLRELIMKPPNYVSLITNKGSGSFGSVLSDTPRLALNVTSESVGFRDDLDSRTFQKQKRAQKATDSSSNDSSIQTKSLKFGNCHRFQLSG